MMFASNQAVLQPLTGEVLSGASAIREDAARLDIAANGFWEIIVRERISMFESSTLWHLQTINPCKHAIESMRI